MTLQLNFDQTQQNNLLQHIQWLLKVGLIQSFNLASEALEDEAPEVSEAEFQALLQASNEVKNGKFHTHEDVKSMITEWRKTR